MYKTFSICFLFVDSVSNTSPWKPVNIQSLFPIALRNVNLLKSADISQNSLPSYACVKTIKAPQHPETPLLVSAFEFFFSAFEFKRMEAFGIKSQTEHETKVFLAVAGGRFVRVPTLRATHRFESYVFPLSSIHSCFWGIEMHYHKGESDLSRAPETNLCGRKGNHFSVPGNEGCNDKRRPFPDGICMELSSNERAIQLLRRDVCGLVGGFRNWRPQ